ncbi:MAG: hypothetical protein ACHP83_16200 [Burkholderiales bacterium]
MRSIEFFTYLLPSGAGSGAPTSRRLTRWQAIAWPDATPVEGTREVRECPESAEEREALGFTAPPAQELPPKRRGRARAASRRGR